MKKKAFITVVLDLRHKTFIMHIILFVNSNNSLVNEIYFLNKIYIKSYVFVVNQAITLIFIKYSDFADLFFFQNCLSAF